MASQREPYIVGPGQGHEHTHTVIFLHGYGSNSEEFASELFECEASEPRGEPRTLPDQLPSIRWVFPTAPILRSTRFEMDMSIWFDVWAIWSPHEEPALQEEGLKRSVAEILDVVRSEEAHVPRDKIFLAGISQGFATAVAVFLAEGRGGFAGLVGLSSWMPYGGPDELVRLVGDASRTTNAGPTRILLCHSSDDGVVPVKHGRALRDVLAQLGHTVEWHEYADGAHWVNEPEGVDDIVVFIWFVMASQ